MAVLSFEYGSWTSRACSLSKLELRILNGYKTIQPVLFVIFKDWRLRDVAQLT
jgi:hypothetical protein